MPLGLKVWVEFGQKVRALRKGRDWTQGDLAEKLKGFEVDTHQSTIAKMESGTRPTVTHEVWALASVFEVGYDDLLPRPEGGSFSLNASVEERQAAIRNRALEEALAATRARLEADQRALAELEARVLDSRREVDMLGTLSIPADISRDWARREAVARLMLDEEARVRHGEHPEEG